MSTASSQPTEKQLDAIIGHWSTKFAAQLERQARKQAPSKIEIFSDWVIKVLGIIVAALFGVFSILAWQASESSLVLAQTAINMTQVSNQVALLSMCQQLNVSKAFGDQGIWSCTLRKRIKAFIRLNTQLRTSKRNCANSSTDQASQSGIPSMCNDAVNDADLASLLSQVFPTTTPTSAPTVTATPSPSGNSEGLSQSQKIAIGVGVGLAVPSFIVSSLAMFSKFSRPHY